MSECGHNAAGWRRDSNGIMAHTFHPLGVSWFSLEQALSAMLLISVILSMNPTLDGWQTHRIYVPMTDDKDDGDDVDDDDTVWEGKQVSRFVKTTKTPT